MRYKIFDVIIFDMIHNNHIFEDLKKGDVVVSSVLNNSGNYDSKYVKTRPAIIVRDLLMNGRENYFIVPTTTKKSIGFIKELRTEVNFLQKNRIWCETALWGWMLVK